CARHESGGTVLELW
nr:immunoglobulin heavy chain junction region [Macaca mulatta]MOW80928.1 immunoglobulin heavy chain junction region [Macaca mulatta]MOW81815.1 immunoglobulin heavy chain junction region [Macaca mulatta]